MEGKATRGGFSGPRLDRCMRHARCLSRDDPFHCAVITDGNDKAAPGVLLLAVYTLAHGEHAEKATGARLFVGRLRIYVDKLFSAVTEISQPPITCIYRALLHIQII